MRSVKYLINNLNTFRYYQIDGDEKNARVPTIIIVY